MSLDAVHDLQAAFRGLLEAFSFPGRPVALSVPEGFSALELAAAALIDQETSYAVGSGPLAAFLLEWTAARPVAVDEAAFVLLPRFDDAVLAGLIAAARPGTLTDPHRGATLLIGVDELSGARCRIAGPGIETPRECDFPAGSWIAARNEKVKEFPLGVDLAWFDRDHRVVALPRTTSLELAPGARVEAL